MSNNLLQVRNLTLTVPHKVLCQDIMFSVQTSQKVWLVARNGSGKSTLLKCLAWLIEPDEGIIEILPTVTVWYLAQADSFDPEATVWETMIAHDNQIGQAVIKYEQAMQRGDDDALLEATQTLTWLDGRDYETNVSIAVNQLQLTDLVDQKIKHCSWWELKRVALAKLLIEDPDLLLIDEPTNHLDLEMIQRLEDTLKRSRYTIVVVTHDRYFLEKLCDTIIELDHAHLYSYPGNYSKFLDLKEQREATQALQHHKLKQELKKETERMRKAPRARETKSVKREKEFYELEKQFKWSKQFQYKRTKTMEFDLMKRRVWWKILEIKQINKAFGDKIIADEFSYTFTAWERIWLVWPNGVGKSTFLKMIMGIEAPDNGVISLWETMTIGWYQQNHQPYDESKKVIDIIKDQAEYIFTGQWKQLSAGHFLERFLFSPQQQHQRAYTLSGWEKRRLHLASILITNPNFLILDEPTNDLDIETLQVLESFLLSFNGCLMVVSHDRWFMDTVIDHLFVFEGDGIIREFPGNWSDWKGKWTDDEGQIIARHSGNLSETKACTTGTSFGRLESFEKSTKADKLSSTVWSSQDFGSSPGWHGYSTDSNNEPQTKKKLSQKRKALSNKEREELKQIEQRIEHLELRKSEIEQFMIEHAADHEKMGELGKEISEVASELWDVEERWLELNS